MDTRSPEQRSYIMRSVSAQFMSDDRVAMFELTVRGDAVKVVEERHYKLVPAKSLDHSAILDYRT
jgi:hypothetical protein